MSVISREVVLPFTSFVTIKKEEAIEEDEEECDEERIEILVGHHKIADIDDQLEQSIAGGNIEMRDFQFVDHCLVGMFAVGLKDIASREEALGDSQQSVGEEDADETEDADADTGFGKGLDITNKEEEDDKPHRDAPHIAREAARLGSEIEETENQNSYHYGSNQLYINKGDNKEVNISHRPHNDQRIGGEHTVDAVHEVVDVEYAREEYH